MAANTSFGTPALEALMDSYATTRVDDFRLELERELSQIDARAGESLTTLQEFEVLIQEHQGIIQAQRAIIEASEATIRTANERSQTLRQQRDNDNNRREEISITLSPESMREKWKQTRHEVKVEYFIHLRSSSVDPCLDNPTMTRPSAGPATTTLGHRQQPGLEGIPEVAEEHAEEHDDGFDAQRVRRSGRKRTIRHYYDSGLASPELDVSDGEIQREAVREEQSRPTDDERHHNSRRRKKAKLTGRSEIPTRGQDQNPIDYDEVFGNGNAEVKYNIIEYPENSDRWYILRCLEHNQHFCRGALQAGAKHLNGSAHNNCDRNWDLAFQMFHVPVLNCDAEKAARNNLAVRKAIQSGYKGPMPTKKARPAAQQSQRYRRPPPIVVDSQHSTSVLPTLVPTVGQMYKISGEPALAVVLPIVDLSVTGITGLTVTADWGKPPGCYYFKRREGIYEWESHYRREHLEHRQYPILVFRGDMEIPRFPEEFVVPRNVDYCEFMFLKPGNLTIINIDDPGVRGMEGYDAAKAFQERMEACRASTFNRQDTERQAEDSSEPRSETGNAGHDDGHDYIDWGDDGYEDDDQAEDSDDYGSDSDQEDSDTEGGSTVDHGYNGQSSRVSVRLTPPQPEVTEQPSHQVPSLDGVGSQDRAFSQPDMDPSAKPGSTSLETNPSAESLENPEDLDADAWINEILGSTTFDQEHRRDTRRDEAESSSSGASVPHHGQQPDRRLSTGEHDPTNQFPSQTYYLGQGNKPQVGPAASAQSTISQQVHVCTYREGLLTIGGLPRADLEDYSPSGVNPWPCPAARHNDSSGDERITHLLSSIISQIAHQTVPSEPEVAAHVVAAAAGSNQSRGETTRGLDSRPPSLQYTRASLAPMFPGAHSTIPSSSRALPSTAPLSLTSSFVEAQIGQHGGTRKVDLSGSGNSNDSTSTLANNLNNIKPGRAAVADMSGQGGVDKSGMPMRTIDRNS